MQVKTLSPIALEVEPVEMDWSEGFGDTWDYAEAPSCPECGDYARWDNGANGWFCQNDACELKEGSGVLGEEIDPAEGGAEGPMMNYYYPLPASFDLGWYEAADLIRDLPLCLVYFEDGREQPYALALTGGGMDLSWQICEAFMRLGYLPPAHFADLPGMAGVGDRPEEREVIAACVESLKLYSGWLVSRGESMRGNAERLAERYGLSAVES